MEEYVIQPWDGQDQMGNLDMWVPPELDELAQMVITDYDMKVYKKTLITSKPDKGGAIWKIKTDQGPRSLKVLHRKPSRSLFSIGAQDYITKQGGRVPELKKAKDGFYYVQKGGKLWIVTDWIESLTPASKDLEGAQSLCYGLGEFHGHSRGYIPPVGAQRASRLYRWPAYYQKIINKMDWFRNIAKAYSDFPNSQILLSALEIFEPQALKALDYLNQSSYVQLVSKGEEHWGLVHQDYGWSNGQLGIGGLWVIDLDGVAYDLPIRDLRKLISGTMDDLGRWDVTWIRSMIDAYHQANHLDLETYGILLNDLAFPNEFYKHLNEMLYDPMNFINNDLDGIIQHLKLLEETKGLALAELKLNQHKFGAGNYASTVSNPENLEIKPMKNKIIPNSIELSKGQFSKEINNLHENENLIENKILKKNENSKLKVLMICTEKLPVPPVRGGAIQTYIQGISGILSQHHNLTILGTTDPSLPLEEFKQNIRYVRIDGQQVLEIYAEKVISFLLSNSFDLIHVFNRPRLIPLIRLAAPHSRIILSMHNDMFETNKIHQYDALTAINEVEQIITVSDYVGNKICNLYPQASSKVHTIYSGVNLETFIPWENSASAAQTRQKLRKEHDLEAKTVILFVGRLTPKKGADLLIHALNEVYLFDSNIALVIVGGTWYSVDTVTDYVAYVRALAERAHFPVITTGYVSADLIHERFWAADIFVCPSVWQEPLARVHYEAMAAGLPFITTARGGNPEVVIKNNGLIVEPEDRFEFAEKLKILILDSKLRHTMGRKGRQIAEERFSWERVANEVLETWKPGVNPETDVMFENTDLEQIEDIVISENLNLVRDLGKDNNPKKDNLSGNNEIVLDPGLEMEFGSSVMKINRGKIIPIKLDNNAIIFLGPSVIKITRELIHY